MAFITKMTVDTGNATPNKLSDTPLITIDKPEIVPIINLLGTRK
jgi:hypothetical protein